MLKELEKPEVQRVYTTAEIAMYLNTSEYAIRNIANYYRIDKVISPTKNSRAAFYSYEAVRLIKSHFDAKKNKEKQKQIKAQVSKPDLSLEELRKLHPLVKDDRFFNTSFFPDVTPECFKVSEVEECIN